MIELDNVKRSNCSDDQKQKAIPKTKKQNSKKTNNVTKPRFFTKYISKDLCMMWLSERYKEMSRLILDFIKICISLFKYAFNRMVGSVSYLIKNFKKYITSIFLPKTLTRVIVGTLIVLILYSITTTYYDHKYIVLKEYELEYWNAKHELCTEVDSFIKSVAPKSDISPILIVENCDDYDVSIILLLSQAWIESHFGTKGLAVRTNNPWNFGAFDQYCYNKVLGIHKFSHPNEAIKSYTKLIKEDYLGNDKTEEDLLVNFVNKNGHRYASNTTYEEELRMKYKYISNKTDIVNKIETYRYWKLKSNR